MKHNDQMGIGLNRKWTQIEMIRGQYVFLRHRFSTRKASSSSLGLEVMARFRVVVTVSWWRLCLHDLLLILETKKTLVNLIDFNWGLSDVTFSIGWVLVWHDQKGWNHFGMTLKDLGVVST